MSPRYLLIVGDSSAYGSELLAHIPRRTGLEMVFANARIAAFANPACRCLPIAKSGCILGSLFHRHGPAQPLAGFAVNEAASVASSNGQALLSTFWGGYVAAIAGQDSVRVLRDPSGTFPCYYASWSDFVVLASDAVLLIESGLSAIHVDLEEIGRQLYRAFVPAPTTALDGIRELLAGFALSVPGRSTNQESAWSPWDYVLESGDAPGAAERLSRTLAHTVHALASGHRRLLLSVSGGLDSSIVAACLARAGADTVCLTMFTDDPGGDERTFARATCARLGLPLIEQPYRLEDIDITKPLAPHLPRPRDRIQATVYERVHLKAAADIGADAFVTGNGGDNVFGYSQSAASAADRYLTEGLAEGAFAALLDVCRQTGCSVFDAFRQAWRLVHGSPAHHVQPNSLLLDPDFARGLAASDLWHPWLEAPAGALPGKAAHISTILRAQPNLEASRGSDLPVLNPLMSQPIIETCVAIPTWEWRAGGRDRSLARRAFAHELPPIVLNRRVKGTPSRFAARLLDHFRAPIRERLLGGRLAAHRIIDAVAVEKMLAGERPVPDLERVRILELVNGEAWIDHWTSLNQACEPRKPDIRSDVHGPPLSSNGPIP